MILAASWYVLTTGAVSPAQTSVPLKHQVDFSIPTTGKVQIAAIGANLVYFGGRIVSNPIYYNVYWGPNVATYHGDIDLFMGDLGTLEFNSLLSQYATTGHTPGTNQTIGLGAFGGGIIANPSPQNSGNTVDDRGIQGQLRAWITAGAIPAPQKDAAGNNNTIYNVLFPHGVTITQAGGSSCQAGGFCAYHGTLAGGVTSEFYYTVLPDMGAGSGCDIGCGTGTALQNLTSVLSQAIAETITDAEVDLAPGIAAPLAWYDSTNGEIGHICNTQQGNMTGPSGRTWTVQYLWSNAQSQCELPQQVYQIITFNALSNRVFGSSPFPVSATASTGFAINFTGGTANVCSVTGGGMVTILGAGQCSLTANQPGGPIGGTVYAPAPPVTQSFQVTRAPQTITIPAISDRVLGTPPFTITATASSGLPVHLAATPLVCTVSGNTVILIAVGQCSIQATQIGDANYPSAMPVYQSFQVTATSPSGSLVNGGFETGNLTGWTSTGTTQAVSGAHTGSYAAQVGSAGPTTDSSVAQTLIAPTGATTLTFWYWVVCPDTVTYDWASATLKDNTVGATATMLANTCSNSRAWVQATAPVTPGHIYTLTLSNHDDNYGNDPTYTLYDDVTVNVGAPPPPSGITNGGFETGTLSGWTSTGTASVVANPHSGSSAAQLGGTSATNGDSTITQTFTTPTNATQLSLFYSVHCPDTVTYDWAMVTLKDNTLGTTNTVVAKTCSNAGNWVNALAPVTPGHSYTLTLLSHDDNYSGDPTYTWYDDVVLR